MLDWETLDEPHKIALRIGCEQSFSFFLRCFFQFNQGQSFLWNWHHARFCSACEDVAHRRVKRLIVNTPPGSTKTEVFSIFFVAWGIQFCSNRGMSSRWLPISYSSDLVGENGSRVLDLVNSEPFQSFWPMDLSKRFRSKDDWLFTDANGKAHRLYGASLGGQVTGRRAGYMVPGFSGAAIVDDPQPPKDESKPIVIHKSNQLLNRVVRSRLAHDSVPIVVVQQRVAKFDATDFLLSDKHPDDWVRIKVPAALDKDLLKQLPEPWRSRALRETHWAGGRVSYWEDKEPIDFLNKLEMADNFLFNSQYQQEPGDAEVLGQVFHEQIRKLIEDDRFGPIPIEKSLPVYTAWDLGGPGDASDPMAIWFIQAFRFEIRLIAAYSNKGKDFDHYVSWLNEFKEKHGIHWGKHFGPHDLQVKQMFGKGKTRLELARDAGIQFTLIPRVQNKGEAINATKRMFHRFYIDVDRCNQPMLEGRGGWDALKAYRFEYDPVNEVYTKQPVHDWSSNLADALQQLAIAWDDERNRNESQNAPLRSVEGWMGR